jgi:hypothetical protein
MNALIPENTHPVISDGSAMDKIVIDYDPIPLCTEISENKDMMELPDGVIRFPCRARGVDDTHTPRTAYFEIAEDCPHGKTLSCSHKKCRDSGRQFRYCKECNQVTAKRNFSKRHAHGIFTISPLEMKRTDSSGSNSKKRKVSVDEEPSLSDLLFTAMAADPTLHSDSTSSDEESLESMEPTRISSAGADSNILMMLSRKEARLLEIIRNRPIDGESTERWIQDILLATNDDISHDDIPTVDDAVRMPSLDKFEIFTESFDRLIMN